MAAPFSFSACRRYGCRGWPGHPRKETRGSPGRARGWRGRRL